MKKLRVGILGTSNIADRYGIGAFKSLANVELVAVASRSIEKAALLASKHGIAAESYNSLIERKDLDVIYSPLPIGVQEKWVVRAMKAGKHCIVEKSITSSFASAKRMVRASETHGVALYENFVPEFHPQHAKIAALLKEKAIGTPLVWQGVYGFPPFPKNDIRYRTDLAGGALNDCGCYTIYLARKIFVAEPIAVTCTLWNDGHEVDVHGSALVEFPAGKTAFMAFGFDNHYQNTYSVWGSKGIVRTNRAFAIPPTFVPAVELISNDGARDSIRTISVPATNQFALSFSYFCDVIARKNKKEMNSMRTRILKQARVMEALRRSARTGKRVVLKV
jgi:dTDP-3,4-didehydro-2,6-dideoxy-alpha-D-glucose 3-reductase